RRVVLRTDRHDAATPLHALNEPVGFRYLVLDEVLAPLRVQLAEALVAQINVRRLHAAPVWMRWVLIPVPRVARPRAAALRLIRPHLTTIRIQRAQHVVFAAAVKPILALDIRSQLRAAIIYPGLPALA